MPEDEMERLLRAALDAGARSAIGDDRMPPPMHAPVRSSAPARRFLSTRVLAPLAAAAAVIAVVVLALSLSGGAPGGRSGPQAAHSASFGARSHGVRSGQATSTAPTRPSSTSNTGTMAPGTPVHVSLKFGDGAQVGVGMPIIALLSRPITDGAAFARATTVTVDGAPVHGAWYFERRYGDPGHPFEADYRTAHYWPAHAKIALNLPVQGLSAGAGLVYQNSLTLAFSTGPANLATVDDTTHTLTLRRDGKPVGTFPVSLGYPNTPTQRGIKVIMEKGKDISMRGPGYFDPHVKYTQRLTYSGEYLHAAPWNTANLGRADTSNGCTNLSIAAARKLYNMLEVGDVISYPNADGPPMQLGDGYGDWNVSWARWQTGGAVPTS